MAEADGDVSLETFTVTYDRDGAAEQAIVVSRTPDGTRAWGNVTDSDTLAQMCAEEGIGRTGVLAADGTLALDG